MSRKYALTLTLRDLDYLCCGIRNGNYFYKEFDDLRSLNKFLYSKICLSRITQEIVCIFIEEFENDK